MSGGEKSRLILAKLLINPPNFMLLDEPTTHLDLDGVKALTKAFQKYDGTVCFISHDLFFIKEVADHIVEVNNGKVTVYPGGLDYYLDKKNAAAQAQNISKKAAKNESSVDKGIKNENRREKKYGVESDSVKQLNEEHQQAKKRLLDIKTQIKELDKEQQDLETESYVKSRTIAESYQTRDQDKIKEFGRRLKEIQSRLREIETLKRQLEEEKRRVSGG